VYRITVPINENWADRDVETFAADITVFVKEQNMAHKSMLAFKEQLKVFVPMKHAQVNFYHEFHTFLKKYEEMQDKETN
jgi:hypothetical protein